MWAHSGSRLHGGTLHGVPHFGDRRPSVPLRRVVEAFGPTLLRVLAGPSDDADVFDVVVHDPTEAPAGHHGDLVLAVGVRAAEDVSRISRELKGAGVAGIVVKVPRGDPDEVRYSGLGDETTILGLAPEASWSSVAALVRSLLPSSGAVGEPAEDLFGLAEAVSAMVGAAVTIEDTSSRVLAFSGVQDEADAGRKDTILGRRVPAEYVRLLEERGVFKWLERETAPIYIEPLVDTLHARAAVSVRAGGEMLGSMWAVVDEPLTDAQERLFTDAANLVALHMLRVRAEADVDRRVESELVETVLQRGRSAAEAAGRLGISAEPLCVLAAQPIRVDPRDEEAACQQLRLRFAVHSAAVRPHCAVARVGGVVYGIFSGRDAVDSVGGPVVRLAEEFVAQPGGGDVVVGIGRSVSRQAALVHSRADADRAVRVLRHEALHLGSKRRVARFADVQTTSLLLRLADLAAEDGEVLTGPLDALFEYDAERRAGLVDTVAAYLDTFGDVASGAAALHIHPNTFRYRLRRALELGGLDLSDPDVRLAVQLQLRLRGAAGA